MKHNSPCKPSNDRTILHGHPLGRNRLKMRTARRCGYAPTII